MCPRRSDPFYVVTYFIKWVTTSWTHSTGPGKWTSSAALILELIFSNRKLIFNINLFFFMNPTNLENVDPDRPI